MGDSVMMMHVADDGDQNLHFFVKCQRRTHSRNLSPPRHLLYWSTKQLVPLPVATVLAVLQYS